MVKNVILQDMTNASDEQLQKNLENMMMERAQYEKNVLHHEAIIETNKKRKELTQKMLDISCTANERVEPVYGFEKNPEWVALQGQLLRVNGDAEIKNIQDEIERLEGIVNNSKTEIGRFDAAIPTVVEELKKRGVAQ